MATHTLDINPLSFDAIRSGKKTLEVRLRNNGVEQFVEGDTLKVRNRETGESVDRTIAALRSYSALNDLLAVEDLQKNAVVQEREAFVERIRSFQSEADEQQYGIVAIELK